VSSHERVTPSLSAFSGVKLEFTSFPLTSAEYRISQLYILSALTVYISTLTVYIYTHCIYISTLTVYISTLTVYVSTLTVYTLCTHCIYYLHSLYMFLHSLYMYLHSLYMYLHTLYIYLHLLYIYLDLLYIYLDLGSALSDWQLKINSLPSSTCEGVNSMVRLLGATERRTYTCTFTSSLFS